MQALASSEIHLLLQLKPGVPSQVLAGSDLFWCHLTDLLEGLALKLISLDFDFIRCPNLSAQVWYLRSSFGRHVAVPQVPLFASALRTLHAMPVQCGGIVCARQTLACRFSCAAILDPSSRALAA